jgi:UDP-2,4-diacetamido-2,4,6-trideoxy-beta-L-altropyranose hydrolase
MKVAIRADASSKIGSGHITRCLTLANALSTGGTTVRFISRDLPDHLAGLILADGHDIAPLDGEASDEARDAEESLVVAGQPDWMIVDHYDLGVPWETRMRQNCRVLSIDDIARAHDCDVLLDQNYHRDAEARYAGLVPSTSAVLAGSRFALLRPEFAAARHGVEPRDGDVRRLLVFMGGVDANNITGVVLAALSEIDQPDLAVDVVIGASHPKRDELSQLCTSMAGVTLHVQASDMAGLLARVDLAIGAGGSATWERCALGVPTLAVCVADNQRELLHEAGRGGIVYAPDIAPTDSAALAVHLRALISNAGLRHLLSRRGMELIDGQGARRVASVIQSGGITIRRATQADSHKLHVWRNNPAVRAVSNDTSEIALSDHERWLVGVLASDARVLLIGEHDGVAIGVVRFDIIDNSALVSIYLVPEQIGQGRGQALLSSAEAWFRANHPGISTLNAQVRAGNIASQRLFEHGGYRLELTHYRKGL